VRFGAILPILALACYGAASSDSLSDSHLEAIHQQRVAWMRIRADTPLPGIYQDFRAATSPAPVTPDLLQAARAAGVQVLFTDHASGQIQQGVLIAPAPAEPLIGIAPPASAPREKPKHLRSQFKQYPQEVFALAGAGAVGPHPELELATSSTHVLARELGAGAIAASLAAGRTYAAADWLCDPAGFFFVAETILGVYDIGDHAPMLGAARLLVNLPISARITLERNGETVADEVSRQLAYDTKIPGDYRLRVSVDIDGETWRWIDSDPIHLENAPLKKVA